MEVQGPGALPDPLYEVIVVPGKLHPVSDMIISLDPTLGASVTLTLRDPDTTETFQVEVADLEVDFDVDEGNFVISGSRSSGGRVNGRIYTQPADNDVVGKVRLSL